MKARELIKSIFILVAFSIAALSACNSKDLNDKKDMPKEIKPSAFFSAGELKRIDTSNAEKQEGITPEKLVRTKGSSVYGVHYPTVGAKNTDAIIKAFAENQINEFNEKAKDKDKKRILYIDYKCSVYNNIVSAQFYIQNTENDQTNTSIRSMNLDKESGKSKQLSDFFYPDTKYMNAIINQASLCFNTEQNNKTEKNRTELITSLSAEKTLDKFSLSDKGFIFVLPSEPFGIKDIEYTSITLPYFKMPDYVDMATVGQPALKASYDKNTVVEGLEVSALPALDSIKRDKVIAFTFDDGPFPKTTARLIDGLNKMNARVTFFIVGNRIDKAHRELNAMISGGHQIGNHTYDHTTKLTKVDREKFDYMVDTVDTVLMKSFNIKTNIMRPVGGAVNANVYEWTKTPMVRWSIDTEDYKYKTDEIKTAASEISKKVIEKARDGDIVLFHDIYDNSVDAALLAVDALSRQGFEFLTVDEMFARKGIPLTRDKYYRSAHSR